MQDKLIIDVVSMKNADQNKEHICLAIGRKRRGKYEPVNELYDEEAKKVYKQLTGRSI